MYLSLFRIQFIGHMQYRLVMVGEILMRFCWGFMEVLAFSALYRTGAAFSMELPETVSYLWMQQILLPAFTVAFGDGEICSSIASGSISYELVRPMSLYGRWFCQLTANRVSFICLNCLPAFLLALLAPSPYRMSLPPAVGQLALFLASAVLALCVVGAFSMLTYISLFYILSQRGVRMLVSVLTSFLSGGVVPLPFFPAPVLAVVQLLPFAAMMNLPLRIYSGNIAGTEAVWGIAFQLFWLAALLLLGRLAMGRATGKVIVQGG